MERSRSKRRVYVKTPSGKNKVHYQERKHSPPKCGDCKIELKGVSMSGNLSKKRVSRIYGGNLCHKCVRKRIVEKWLK